MSNASEMGLEYILICQDDHQFSAYYNREYFEKCIEEAIEKNAEGHYGDGVLFIVQTDGDPYTDAGCA
ncbi:hypothetical protein LZF95_26060 [Algoriphagus sp. AGSA1]|uniref:hypothetical protein n=1 Tax=Algoriphagus sp. AGSA1 TaxID=2907213 RepID=UPI001F158F4F|nr:hypothetical protein [Algoriphagus sp. AGSA1]MCE7058175.1 hypothetical protein [Algoriphagus sp. AGSA1]